MVMAVGGKGKGGKTRGLGVNAILVVVFGEVFFHVYFLAFVFIIVVQFVVIKC